MSKADDVREVRRSRAKGNRYPANYLATKDRQRDAIDASGRKDIKVGEAASALFKSAGNIADAARLLGCTRQTLWSRIQENKTLKAVCEEAVEITLDLAESKLVDQIKKGNLGAICFYLKTRGRKRGYVEKQEIETSGSTKQIHVYTPALDPLPED